MRIVATAIIFMASTSAPAQSSYKGMTPGVSGRSEIERGLGKPVKALSPTLVEYLGGSDANSIYVQYDSSAKNAIALRIELICQVGQGKEDRRGCVQLYNALVPNHHKIRDAAPLDARIVGDTDERWSIKDTLWHPAPYFVVQTFRQTHSLDDSGSSIAEWRVGLYSKELYETAVPRSCTGTALGVWNTSRGRMTIVRADDRPKPGDTAIKGTYSPNGEISGIADGDGFKGEWKDSTGTGTMTLSFNDEVHTIFRGLSFEGEWERKTGKGARSGKWTGKCVQNPT